MAHVAERPAPPAARMPAFMMPRGRVDDVVRRSDGRFELVLVTHPMRARVTFDPPRRSSGVGRLELVAFDGARRALGTHERQILAAELDRRTSAHRLGPRAEAAGLQLLYALLQDPCLDPRWHAPNLLLDAALREGRLVSRVMGRGLALGPRVGPIETLTLRLGADIERTVYRELDAGGPPRLSKQMADGAIVALSLGERMSLSRLLYSSPNESSSMCPSRARLVAR